MGSTNVTGLPKTRGEVYNVAEQLIISQVCNGHRHTGFGHCWEFPHRGRQITLETRPGIFFWMDADPLPKMV